jgi:hypothetical protein
MRADSERGNFQATVHPKIGVGSIRFGASADAVTAELGSPEKSWVDEEGDRLLAYSHAGVAFFAFDPEEDMRLVSYELTPASDAELWGLRVFQVPRDAIIQAAATLGLRLQQARPDAPHDETLFQIRSHGLDFYYEQARLVALGGGVGFSLDDSIEWPAAP